MASAAFDIQKLLRGSRVYIIGLGGIGTSAVAQWLRQLGYTVTGSDGQASAITSALSASGIRVVTGTHADFPTPLPSLVIYSDAIPVDHPLRHQAHQYHIPQLSYAVALGQLMRRYRTVAIAGSHGKSTTTAMTGLLLAEVGLDPTVIIGTLVPAWRTATALGNFRAGKSQIAVVEADEYRRHFHELRPEVAVITSVDYDHVDAFPTPADYLAAFGDFITHLAPKGTIVIHEDAYASLKNYLAGKRVVIYKTPAVTFRQGRQEFNGLSLAVPGVHMAANAVAAVAAATALTGQAEAVTTAARRVFARFTGTWRRFEPIGTFQGAGVFSDYAHHPTEVAALVQAAHQHYPQRRLVLVFQPHQRARAAAFASDFIAVLKRELRPTDAVVLCEVYDVAGREETGARVTTRDWAVALGRSAQYVAELTGLAPVLRQLVTADDIVVFAGAGSIDAAARQLVTPPTQPPAALTSETLPAH